MRKTAFKKIEGIWSVTDHIPSNFLKAVFHKLYLVHSWVLCPISLYIRIQALSLGRRILDPIKHLWWIVIAEVLGGQRPLTIFAIKFRHVFDKFLSSRTQNRKQGEPQGETWEIPKETGETIGETRGGVWRNRANM